MAPAPVPCPVISRAVSSARAGVFRGGVLGWRCDHEQSLFGLKQLGKYIFETTVPALTEQAKTPFAHRHVPEHLSRLALKSSGQQIALGLISSLSSRCWPDHTGVCSSVSDDTPRA